MVIWTHLPIDKPKIIRVEPSTLMEMDRAQKQRDAIFNNQNQRIAFLNGINNMQFFEMNSINGESGVMMAADIAYRIDQLIDEMFLEANLDLF